MLDKRVITRIKLARRVFARVESCQANAENAIWILAGIRNNEPEMLICIAIGEQKCIARLHWRYLSKNSLKTS